MNEQCLLFVELKLYVDILREFII